MFRGKNKMYCTCNGRGANMIGQMLTRACEFPQAEFIGDRPLMNTLRITARARVIVHSKYGITYGLMVKGSYGIMPAHLCFF